MLDLDSIQLELDELDLKFPNSMRNSMIDNPYREESKEMAIDLSKLSPFASVLSTERV